MSEIAQRIERREAERSRVAKEVEAATRTMYEGSGAFVENYNLEAAAAAAGVLLPAVSDINMFWVKCKVRRSR